jgi:DNA-binding MarR family transcriptional regulator
MSSPQRANSRERDQLTMALIWEVRQTIADTGLLFDRIARARGLNVTDVQCHNLLSQLGPMTAGKLAELTHLTTGAITNIVDRLEQRGYVERVRDPQDRRKVIIEPKDPGQDEMEFFLVIQQQFLEILSAYSEQELSTILSFLKQLHPISASAMKSLEVIQTQKKADRQPIQNRNPIEE